MKNNNQSIEDIQAIRKMMEDSSKFLSLSGLSGVCAGIFALIGAIVAWIFILDNGSVMYDVNLRSLGTISTQTLRINLFIDAILILIGASLSAFYFSNKKAKEKGVPFWSQTTKKMLVQLLIPLITGGCLSLIIAYRHDIRLVGAVTLIFYGLALVNAGKYTHKEIYYLGISEIIIGLIAGIFLNYGLLFWAIGFGVLHIIYGVKMYCKYDCKIEN